MSEPVFWNYAPALEIECNLVRCKDGDTYVVESANSEKPFYPFKQLVARLKGCDTPELHDARKDIAAIAWAALDEVNKYVGCKLLLKSMRSDEYGRIEADVGVYSPQGYFTMKEHLITLRLALPWNGRGKSPWITYLPDSKNEALGSVSSEP